MRAGAQRLIGLAAVCAIAAIAAGAAWMAGREVVIEAATDRLHAYNAGVVAGADAIVDETRELLRDVRESAHPVCSDAQLTYMRQLVFRARFVRDLGQYMDGKLVCSSGLGRLEVPLPEGFGDIVTPDDYVIHARTGVLITLDVRALVVQHFDSSAVIDP